MSSQDSFSAKHSFTYQEGIIANRVSAEKGHHYRKAREGVGEANLPVDHL